MNRAFFHCLTGYKKLFLCLGGSFFIIQTALAGPTTSYPSDRRPSQQANDPWVKMRHELTNHESEIRMIEEKLNNHEETLDALRQTLLDNDELHKNLLKDNNSNLSGKVEALEAKVRGLASDFGVLKTHANDSTVILGQYKQKIHDLEKILEAQRNQLSHLETAMRSLTDLIQVKESLTEPSEEQKIYRVQSGDTLEKIARNQRTTIQALREKNHLTHDKIFIGQKLVIP